MLKKRVVVWVRSHDGVRGKLTGTVKVFDKHMNIVLADAHEEYTATTYVDVPADWRTRPNWKRKPTPEPMPRPRLQHYDLKRKPALEEKLASFFEAYKPELKDEAARVASHFKNKGSELSMWSVLHRRYKVLDRFEQFYRAHNPEKIKNVPKALEKYAGREVELEVFLQKRYKLRSKVWRALTDIADARHERAHFDGILREYFGREDKLIEDVRQKYYQGVQQGTSSRSRSKSRSYSKRVPKVVTRTRKLKQILIRGDVVAMVAIAQQ